MPIVGFIASDGETSDQPEGLGHCSFDYALQLAQERHESFPFPYPLLKAIRDSIQDRGDHLSVTSILHCLRAEFLKRKTSYYARPEDMYPAFRGTLFHKLLEENAPPNARLEERFIRTYKGIEIGGQFDSLLTFEEQVDGRRKYVLQDWKTTENLPKYDSPYTNHMIQINLYRWLLGLAPTDVTMEVVYFNMKGVKICRLKDGSQPSRGGRAPINQHWTDTDVERYLDDRLIKLKASFITGIPLPYAYVGEDEKWECEYCPVRRECSLLARDEQEAVWRKSAGLPPAGTPADVSPLWENLLEDIRYRIANTSASSPTTTPVSDAEVSKPRRQTRNKGAAK